MLRTGNARINNTCDSYLREIHSLVGESKKKKVTEYHPYDEAVTELNGEAWKDKGERRLHREEVPQMSSGG